MAMNNAIHVVILALLGAMFISEGEFIPSIGLSIYFTCVSFKILAFSLSR